MTDTGRVKEEQYIISESQEISVGEIPGWLGKFYKAFPALKNRNYQLYFTGQLISLIGSWLQIITQGWLVFELTRSAFWVGFVATASSLPVLIFSLFGGVLVDRFDKKKIIYVTQGAFMILAFILGIMTMLKIINVYEIALIAFLFGVLNAIDIPSRQAFVTEMVGREKMASAIALNSGAFNGARIIGPTIASILIAFFGVGIAFIVNGISYIAAFAALKLIKIEGKVHYNHLHPLAAIHEGIVYSYKKIEIRTLLISVGVVSVFGWAFMAILPVIAQGVYHGGIAGLGYLYTSFGVGAVLSTILLSTFSNKINPKYFIIGGNIILCLALTVFSLAGNFGVAVIAIFVIGFSLIVQNAAMNSTIQYSVEDHFRGRVMSIYILMFLGLSTIGNFEIGVLAEHFGVRSAILANTGLLFILSFIFLYRNKRVWQEVDKVRNHFED